MLECVFNLGCRDLLSNPFGFRSLKQRKVHPVDAPLVSILVRVKNESRALDAFLASLKRQSLFERTEVIFLDSGSTDTTLEKLSAFPASVYSIDSSEFVFGATCNLVCSLARAPYLSLMSGHIELADAHVLEKGVAVVANAGARVAAYYRQVPNEALGASAYERAQLRRRFPPGSEPKEIASRRHAFSNAASIFTAAAWKEIPFPAVAASEDHLWAEQLIAGGGKIIYLPDTAVKHSHNETPDELFKRVALNVNARPEDIRSWYRAAKYFLGVSVACMLEGSGPSEALRYGHAHASAYAPKRG